MSKPIMADWITRALYRDANKMNGYICGYCNKEFVGLLGLINHVVTKHNDKADGK